MMNRRVRLVIGFTLVAAAVGALIVALPPGKGRLEVTPTPTRQPSPTCTPGPSCTPTGPVTPQWLIPTATRTPQPVWDVFVVRVDRGE